jgi:heme-degrading monooxygenase HmoA
MGATSGLKALFPPTSSKPKSQGQEPALLATLDLHLLRSSMSLTSWLCVGAAVQAAISLFRIPFYLSLVLILGVLGYRTGHALLITFKLIPNPYLEDAIFNYTSAQIPNRETGEFSDTPAAEPVGILHLGAKINHPLGAFSPHAQPLIKYAETMYKVLDSDAKKSNGYLGGQSFDTVDKNGCMELTFISYWRNIEAIHDFAYSSAHRKGWEVSCSDHLRSNVILIVYSGGIRCRRSRSSM